MMRAVHAYNATQFNRIYMYYQKANKYNITRNKRFPTFSAREVHIGACILFDAWQVRHEVVAAHAVNTQFGI
jgi:hypothetical protein